jgi:hypothetical protein
MANEFAKLTDFTRRHVLEQRQSQRRKLIGLVEVLEPSGNVSMKGSIFNVSDTGMMIGTTLDYRFPNAFTVKQAHLGAPCAAELVWHHTGLAGLKFKK